MILRWLSRSDLTQWRSLRAEALRLFPEAFLTTSAEFADQSNDQVASVLDQGKTLGVFDQERLVGAAAFLRHTRPQTRHRAELAAVYVTPSHQGKRPARDLIETLSSHAKTIGVTQLELSVWDGNPRALRFYKRHGFVEMGRFPNAVVIDGEGRDDIFMVKSL